MDTQLERLEETLMSIQEAQHTAQVLARLKEGSAALKQLQVRLLLFAGLLVYVSCYLLCLCVVLLCSGGFTVPNPY